MTKSFAIASFSTLGDAYVFLNEISSREDQLRCEVIPSANSSYVLCASEKDFFSQENLFKNCKQHLVGKNEEENAQILQAWYGQSTFKPGSCVVIYEVNELVQLFVAAQDMIREKLEIFEMRCLRGAQLKGYILATGPQLSEPLKAKIQGQGHLTYIAEPYPQLCEFLKV